MVQVLEDYLIDVSEMNYTVKVRNGFTNSGEVSWKHLGYYGTMHGALKGIAEAQKRKRLKKGIHSLEEAVQIILDADKALEDEMARCHITSDGSGR